MHNSFAISNIVFLIYIIISSICALTKILNALDIKYIFLYMRYTFTRSKSSSSY